ncbi:MAG: SHOCT domain-containing protein [Limisphaerales bacterium]|jgi:hypothetical protein
MKIRKYIAHRSVLMGVLLSSLVLWSGCAWSIGGEKEGGTVVRETTKGQELIDLKRALDQGAINQEEYDRERSVILSR